MKNENGPIPCPLCGEDMRIVHPKLEDFTQCELKFGKESGLLKNPEIIIAAG